MLFSDINDSYVKAVIYLLDVESKNEALKFLGISMGGVLIGLQAFISYRRAKAIEDTVENTEKGQRQERLKNAIEHLGHDSSSIRLGGAYELFHLAQDTKELRQTVLDILCAHIRQTTGENDYREEYQSKPSEEIQSLLTLLFVQDHGIFKGLHINLQGSWLNGVELNKARLEKAILIGTRLQKANLMSARMQLTDLTRAWLQGAYLSDAKLQGTILSKAKLQGASLSKAQLPKASLAHAELHGADLSRTQLQGVNLLKTQLQGAYWFGTELQGAQTHSFYHRLSFEERIEDSINRETDLSEVIFSGGLLQEDVDSLVEDLSDGAAKKLRERLKPHVGKPVSHELAGESGAVTDSYTKEEAEQWIAEYKEAMPETFKENHI